MGMVCAQSAQPGGVAGLRVWLHPVPDATYIPQGILVNTFTGDTTYFQGDTLSGPAQAINHHLCLSAPPGSPSVPIDTIAGQQASVFLVYAPPSNEERLLWSMEANDTSLLSLTTQRVARFIDHTYLNYAQGAQTPVRLQSYFHRREAAPPGAYRLRIAAPPPAPQFPVERFNGALPELLLYNRVLTPLERQRVESRLAIMYGITLDRADYLDSRGRRIWDAKGNAHYAHNIFGVGSDTAGALVQRVSASSNEPALLTLAFDAITTWNDDHALLDDGAFLLCGDDGRQRRWAVREAGRPQYLDRRWRMQCTDAGQLATALRVDPHMIDNAPENGTTYWLMIDRTGSGQEAYGSTDLVPGTLLLADSTIHFRDVHWDTDGNGTDVFTLAAGGSFLPFAWVDPPTCEPPASGVIRADLVGGTAPFSFRLRATNGAVDEAWSVQDPHAAHPIHVAPGEYTLRMADATGYSVEDVLWIEATDAPRIPLNDTYTLTAGTNLVLDAGTWDDPVTYEWRLNDTLLTTGRFLRVERTGSYTCTVVAGGCPARKHIRVDADAQEHYFDVALMPNPASEGHTVLQLAMDAIADAVVSVIDPMGKEHTRQELKGRSFYQLPLFVQLPGSYLVRVISQGHQVTRKLIVM